MKKLYGKLMLICVAAMMLTSNGQAAAQADEGNNLLTALRNAVTLHPSVKSKIAELQSLGFRLEEAESGRLPTISITAHALTDNVNYDHGSLQAQQTLLSFGKLEWSISLAAQKKELGKLLLLQVRRQLLEDTGAAYVSHWSAKQSVAIAEANVTEHERLYNMIERRQQGGIASEADVRLALSRLIQAQAQRELLRGAAEKAGLALAALTQSALTADNPVDPGLIQVSDRGITVGMAENSEAALKVKAAEMESVQREAALRRAERLPTLYARYERQVTRTTGSASIDRIGVALEGSLDGMGVTGQKRVDAAVARIEAAQENLADTRTKVRERISTLWTERETQRLMIQSYERSVVEIEETMQSFLRQYDAGRKSWIDVLNIQREVADTRLQLEQTRAAWLEMSLRIAAITGQLDTITGVNP